MARKKKAKAQPQEFSAWSKGQTKTAPLANAKKLSDLWEPVQQPKGSPRAPQYARTQQYLQTYDSGKEQEFKQWVNDKMQGTRRERSSVLNLFGKEYGKNQDEKESKIRSQLNLPTTKTEKKSAYDELNKRTASAKNSKALQAVAADKERGGNFFKNLGSNFKDFVVGMATGDGEKAAKAGVKQGDSMGKTGKEIDRFATRATNSALLGLPKALDTKAGAKPQEYERRKDQTKAGTVTDFIADASGYLVPATGAVKGVRAAGVNRGAAQAAKEIAKGNVKGNVGKLAKGTAIEGALVGGGVSTAEEAINAAINPDKFDARQAAKNIGVNTALGAVADPILSVAAPLARNAINARNFQRSLPEMPDFRQPATSTQQTATATPTATPALPAKAQARNSNKPPTYVEGTQRITHHDLNSKTVDKLLNSKAYNDLSQEEFQLLAKAQNNPLDAVEAAKLRTVQKEIDLMIADNSPKSKTTSIPADPKKLTPDEATARLREMESPIATYDDVKKRMSIRDTAKTFTASFNRSIIDSANDLKGIEKALRTVDSDNVLKTLPRGDLKVSDSIYKQSRLLSSSTARAVNYAKDTFTPLAQQLEVHGLKSSDLDEYATAMHAMDIFNTNAQTGKRTVELLDEFDALLTRRPKDMTGEQALSWDKQRREMLKELGDLNPYALPDTATPEWAEAVLTKWQGNQAMQDAHRTFMQIQQINLDNARKAGFIDEPTMLMLNERHPNYISMARDVGESAIKGQGRTKATQPIGKRKDGSTEYKILPATESAMRNYIMTSRNAEKNELMQTIARYAEIDKDGTLFKESKEPIAGRTVTAYFDGQQKHYEVPEYLVNYLENSAKAEQPNALVDAAKPFADLVKKGSTHYNIPFHFISAVRDSASAAMVSRTGQNPASVAAGFLDSFFGKSIEKLSKGKYKSAVDAYEKMGGGASQFISRTDDEIKEMAKAIETGHLKGDKNTVVLNPLRLIEDFGMKMERGARLGEFKQAQKKGYSDRDAFFEATDIMDYSQMGKDIKQANKVVPYLNAAIRGNARVIQAFNEDRLGFLSKGAMYIAAPTAALYMSRFAPTTSEEQRRKIDNMQPYQKNLYWAMPDPASEKIILIPKPHFIGQAFANPVERMLDQITGSTTRTADEEVKAGLKDIASILVPPNSVGGLNTFLELGANKDFFTGYDIESQYDRQAFVPKDERYNQYTSELAKALGNEFVSPAQIDHTIKKTTGSLGTQALDLTDWAANQLLDTTAKPKTLDDIFGKSVKQFTYDPKASLGTTQDIAKAAAMENKGATKAEKKALKEQESATTYNKEMKAINDDIKAVQNDSSMTPEEKKREIESLRNEQRRIGSNFRDWYNSLRN